VGLLKQTTIPPKTGEILIIGRTKEILYSYAKAVCNTLDKLDEETIAGRLRISDEFSLFLYTICQDKESDDFAWDLIKSSLLGTVILYDFDHDTLAELNKLQNLLYVTEAPTLIIGCASEKSAMSTRILSHPFRINPHLRFCLWHKKDPHSARTSLAHLISLILDHKNYAIEFTQKIVNLTLTERLQLLHYMLSGHSPLPILMSMNLEKLLLVEQFSFDMAYEVGILIKKEQFSQNEIIKRLKPTDQYMKEIGCTASLEKCSSLECRIEQPDCMAKKYRIQLERLYHIVADLIYGGDDSA